MPLIGPWELIIVLVIVVVIFGAGRLSQIGGAVGKSVREFRQATVEDDPALAARTTTVATPSATVSVTSAPATVICPSCEHANPATQRFCSECGTALPTTAPAEARTNTCPSCATVNPAGQAFCGQCGTSLTVRAA